MLLHHLKKVFGFIKNLQVLLQNTFPYKLAGNGQENMHFLRCFISDFSKNIYEERFILLGFFLPCLHFMLIVGTT